MFSNSNLLITGGNFNHIALPVESNLNFFRDYIAPGALHNSGERFDPPKCHPNTRMSILQKIMEWIKMLENLNELILWIYGAAGAGKSAIAQTIAEMCEKEGILLGAFFFSRTSPGRSEGNRLIPTLAYQMAVNVPETRSHIEHAFHTNPLVFSQNMESQRDILISQPLKKAISRKPCQVLIIDGLDECSDPKVHSQILTVLASLTKEHSDLRILVASRPEYHILSFFNTRLEHAALRIALNDAQYKTDDDVRMFLNSKFPEIVRNHPLKDYIPVSWPSTSEIETLVSKASGQFIHASTVIKYIDSPRHNPKDRLNIILQLSPSDAHSAGPYEELDEMYRYILESVENITRTKLVLGISLLSTDFLMRFKDFGVQTLVDFSELHYGTLKTTLRTITGIAHVLDISEDDVLLSLTELASVLELLPVEYYSLDTGSVYRRCQEVNFFHASFDDFLKDPTRSKQFYISMEAFHHQAAKGCLRILARLACSPNFPKDPFTDYAIQAMMIHFSKAKITEELLNDLGEFDFRWWLTYNMHHYKLDHRFQFRDETWMSTAANLALFFRRLQSLGKPASSIVRSHLVIIEEQLGPMLYGFDQSRTDRLSLFGGWIVLYECLDDAVSEQPTEQKSAIDLLFSNMSFNCLSDIVNHHLFSFQAARSPYDHMERDLLYDRKVMLVVIRCLRFLLLGNPPLLLDLKYRNHHIVRHLTEIAIKHLKILSKSSEFRPELTAIVEPLYKKHLVEATDWLLLRNTGGGKELKNEVFQYLQTQRNRKRPEDVGHSFTVSHLDFRDWKHSWGLDSI